MSRLLPADIGLSNVSGGGLVAAGIRWATTAAGEGRSRVSHAFLVEAPAERIEDTVIIESTAPKVRRWTLESYLRRGDIFYYRHRLLEDADRELILEAARRRLGEPYGFGKIAWHLLDAVVGKTLSLPVVLLGRILGRRWRGYEPRIFRRLDLGYPLVCSQLVAWAYEQVLDASPRLRGTGLMFPWQTYSPDDLDDELGDSPWFSQVQGSP